MKRIRVLQLLCLAAAGTAGITSTTEASHFRGGFMNASISPEGVLTVTPETLWRKGGDEFSVFPLGGVTRTILLGGVHQARLEILDLDRNVLRSTTDGTLPAPDIVATTTSVDFSDPFFDIRRQEFTLDLPALGLGPGTYILYWTDAARIDGLHNVDDPVFGGSQSPFSLELSFIFDGTARSTPTITSSVITTVAQGQLYSNNLNASGDSPLVYSFIVGSTAPRYGPTTQIPGLTVDPTGQVEIPGASTVTLNDVNLAGEPGGDYVFKVQVTDGDGQYIEQDVMLDVVATPNAICEIIVSDPAPTVFVGQTLELIVTALDPDVLDELTITALPAVPNATLNQVGTNPAVATYTFTPDASQGNTTIGVNFTATDDGSPPLSCVANVQIDVRFDCNGNGIDDDVDIATGTSPDCNGNGIPDECDIDPLDPDGDGFVSPDCNANGIPDECDVASGTRQVFQGGIDDMFGGGPDPAFPSVDFACALSAVQPTQDFDMTSGLNGGSGCRRVGHTFSDLPAGIVAATLESRVRSGNCCGTQTDGILLFFLSQCSQDLCFDALVYGRTFGPFGGSSCFFTSPDPGLVQNEPWVFPDEAFISLDLSALPLSDGGTLDLIPELNRHGFLDALVADDSAADFMRLTVFITDSTDCNNNGIPDECDIASGTSQDCNENGIPDECDIASGESNDLNENGVPDECDPDCNDNGIPDDLDIDPLDPDGNGLVSTDFNDNGIPDECELVPGFEEPVTTEAAGGGNFEAIGDFDDNGTPDIAIIIPGETPTIPGVVQVFLNLGVDEAGIWLGLVATDPVPVGLSPSGIAVGLLDADGLPDVAVTNAGENTVSILINLGVDEFVVWQGLEVFDTILVGNNPSSITAGDLTRDGLTDLALTEEGLPLGLGSGSVDLPDLGRALGGLMETGGLGLVRILINDGDANMGDAGTTPTGGVGPRGLSDPEEVDNDKTGVELIGLNSGGSFLEGEGSAGNVFVLSGDGKGGFGPPLTFDVGENPTDVAVGDLDGDGFPDIAVTNGADGTVSVLLNQTTGAESGTGLFAVVDVLSVGSNPLSVDAADLDGDGDLDLAVVAEDPIFGPAVRILQNLLESGDPLAEGLEGETTLAFGPPASFNIEADPQFIVSADLNGDGLVDLATVNLDDDEPTGGSVTGLVTDPEPIAMPVHLDIKPGACPNSFNRTSNGYLPVALVGNKTFDVLMIDLTTIELTRSDGIGGSVAPNEGPPGPHSVFDDVARPFGDPAATDCGCHTLLGDGTLDLMMKFRRPTLVSVLNLNNLPSGAFVSLKIRGNLLDGTPFEARDCLRLVGNENSGPGRGLD